MRLNANVVLEGSAVTLVPYRDEHVATYHAWMADPWIREMTASEPLSLREEQEMCREWRELDDRLTFIVLQRGTSDTPGTVTRGGGAMVGDVNLFFHPWLRAEGDPNHAVAEVEVMIAAASARRRGLATEALRLLMAYAAVELETRVFVAKIGYANNASQRLFTERLGYRETSRDDGFEEVELTLRVLDDGGGGEGGEAGPGAATRLCLPSSALQAPCLSLAALTTVLAQMKATTDDYLVRKGLSSPRAAAADDADDNKEEGTASDEEATAISAAAARIVLTADKHAEEIQQQAQVAQDELNSSLTGVSHKLRETETRMELDTALQGMQTTTSILLDYKIWDDLEEGKFYQCSGRQKAMVAMMKNVPLLQTLSSEDQLRIAGQLRPIEFADAEAVVTVGEPGDSMFFVENGEAQAEIAVRTLDGSGTQTIVAKTYAAGDYFGELALHSNQPRQATVRIASFSATLLQLDRSGFEILMNTDAVADAMAQQIAAYTTQNAGQPEMDLDIKPQPQPQPQPEQSEQPEAEPNSNVSFVVTAEDELATKLKSRQDYHNKAIREQLEHGESTRIQAEKEAAEVARDRSSTATAASVAAALRNQDEDDDPFAEMQEFLIRSPRSVESDGATTATVDDVEDQLSIVRSPVHFESLCSTRLLTCLTIVHFTAAARE